MILWGFTCKYIVMSNTEIKKGKIHMLEKGKIYHAELSLSLCHLKKKKKKMSPGLNHLLSSQSPCGLFKIKPLVKHERSC